MLPYALPAPCSTRQLVTAQVRAYDLLRMFGREGRPTPPLEQAFAE